VQRRLFNIREMKMGSWSLVVVVLLINSALLHIGHACSPPVGPWKPPTVVEQMHSGLGDDIILMGKILRHFPGSYSSSYTAEMAVDCILKGPNTINRNVNISDAGFVPGMCTAAELEIGKRYIVPVYTPYENNFTFLRALGVAIQQKDFRQAEKACGLNQPTRPVGATGHKKCPRPLPPGKCRNS